jgi:predicted amidohydrolase YtcJ
MTETLLFNAQIRTCDPSRPLAEAVLIRDGMIKAVGSTADIQHLASPHARRIDAAGRLVLPGFQDAHIHLLNGGTDLVETAPLYDCTTLAEIQSVMATHHAQHKGPMIWGAGWQSGFFGDHNLTRTILDTVVPDKPCLIYDGNFHNACLNSAAIAQIGLTDQTPDPMNGHIVRDASGRATGMLHEEAINWATDRLPRTTDDTHRNGLLAGQALANRRGITGIIDPMILDHHTRIYGAAAAQGDLTLRVAGACLITAADTVDTALSRLRALRKAHGSDAFHLNAAKFFLDGGLENRTATLLAPYADPQGGNAPLMYPQEQINALFCALDAERFQIHVHCIGDGATHAALNGFEAAQRANGPWPSLHQIAHCQLVAPTDMPRFRQLGVMANLQPYWASIDPIIPDDTMSMIGPERAPYTYAFRTMIDEGAPYCINSDWAVTTLNPFEIIGTAITREPPRHRGHAPAFFPRERLTVEEAVLGYTTYAAAACWRGHFTGAIKPGYSADLIVLDRDIFTCDPYSVAETNVLLTMFKGRNVHDALPAPNQ